MMEMFTTKLFTGDYHFFDYKYDIESYAGQDAGGAAQLLGREEVGDGLHESLLSRAKIEMVQGRGHGAAVSHP